MMRFLLNRHIERQLVAQFERFVKNTILTQGKPPKHQMTKLIRSVSDNKLLSKGPMLNRNRSKDKNIGKGKQKRRSRKNIKSHSNIKYTLQEPSGLIIPLAKAPVKSKLTIDTSQEMLGSAEDDKFIESDRKEKPPIDQNSSVVDRSTNSINKELKFKQRIQNNSGNLQGSQGVDSNLHQISKDMSSIVSNEEFYIRDNERKYNKYKEKDFYHINEFNDDLSSTQRELERAVMDENKNDYNEVNFINAFEQIKGKLKVIDSDNSSDRNIPNEYDTESNNSIKRSKPNFNEFVRLDDLNDLSLHYKN